MTPTILITEEIDGEWIRKLKARGMARIDPALWQSPDKLRTMLSDYSALIVRNQTQLTEELIAKGTKLKIIGRAGAGLDNIDVDAASRAGIVVTRTPDQNAISVAELALCMMLSLARKLPAANNHVRKGHWQRQSFMGTELYGKTLGVIGLGRIGFLTAARARALGMDILAYDTYVSPDAVAVTETRAKLTGLKELLSQADFVTCHLPLTAETSGFFDYKRFCQMKPTAFFLNLARGEVVAEQGLIRALKQGQILGAGLDVREQEPPEHSALHRMDNVVLTPHIAAFTREAQERVTAAVCKDVLSVLEGKAAQHYVNFPKPKTSAPLIKS